MFVVCDAFGFGCRLLVVVGGGFLFVVVVVVVCWWLVGVVCRCVLLTVFAVVGCLLLV